jgi:hypothetical protein
MYREPLFKGLVFDEESQLVETSTIGSEPCYVIDDAGFKRHVPAEPIDREILKTIGAQISGNEGLIADQTAKMLGQDDLFTHAIIQNQLKNIDQQFNQLLDVGIPEESRMYLGMTGFKVVINIHGEIVKFEQPPAPAEDGDGEGDGDGE